MRSFYHISVMIARGISESVMIAGRISQSSCRSRLSPPLWCPAGGLLSLSPAYPAFGFLSCPLSPQPPSPVGKGETLSLFRRGLRPRHPCIKPFAALTEPAKQVPGGVAQAGGRLPTLPFRHPQGGLPFSSPANPAFGLLSCPLSPRPPSPVGKGETISLFRRGLRPRHPCIKPFAALTVSAMRAPGGGACPRRHWLDLPLWCPQGWRRRAVACRPCHSGTRRGLAFLLACLPCL